MILIYYCHSYHCLTCSSDARGAKVQAFLKRFRSTCECLPINFRLNSQRKQDSIAPEQLFLPQQVLGPQKSTNLHFCPLLLKLTVQRREWQMFVTISEDILSFDDAFIKHEAYSVTLYFILPLFQAFACFFLVWK